MSSRRPAPALLATVTALALSFAWSSTSADPPTDGDTTADIGAIDAEVVFERLVYGSTPTMAWSADSTSLAWTSAWDPQVTANAPDGELGLWTWRPGEPATRRSAEPRHHPLWLGGEILSSCSTYAPCTIGVTATAPDGSSRTIVDESAWRIARFGDAVYAETSWSGWIRVDRAASPAASTAAAPHSFVPDTAAGAEGCHAHRGRLFVSVDPERGVIAHTPDGSFVLDEGRAATWYLQTVAACLSPDGRHVAWARAEEADGGPSDTHWQLRVIALPEPLAAAALDETPWPATTVDAPPPLRRVHPREALRIVLHGSTPVLSWSPDGRHLLYNEALDYLSSWRGDAGSDVPGVFAVHAESGARTRLTAEPRLHPVWVDDQRVATICSMYESCEAGVQLHTLDGDSRTLFEDRTVYNLQAALAGGLLFHDGGYPGSWVLFDPDEGVRLGEIATGLSWDEPRDLVVDRCVPQVANVTAQAGADGLVVALDGEAPVVVDATPAWWYHPAGGASGTRDHSGPIGPCVSPDATRVAWIASTDAGPELRIQPIGAHAAATRPR